MKEVVVKKDTKLDQFLKYTGFVQTGGEAKLEIQEGSVKINGRIETKRGYKLKKGDIVEIESIAIKILLQE